MRLFFCHFQTPAGKEIDDVGLPFDCLEEAYLGVCAALPDMAGELLREGVDLAKASFIISDGTEPLMEIGFDEFLRDRQSRNDAQVRAAIPETRRAAQPRLQTSQLLARARSWSLHTQDVVARGRSMISASRELIDASAKAVEKRKCRNTSLS